MRIGVFGLVLAIAGLAPVAWAQASWEEQLTLQMLQDENCEVTFITQVIERDTPDGKFIQALVGCADQRTFNVLRDKGLKRFTIAPCKTDERAC